MSFFTFYLIWFVTFFAGAGLIGMLDREQPDYLMMSFAFLWLFIFFVKAINSMANHFFSEPHSFRDFINNFSIKGMFLSIKRMFGNILVWTPIILTYIVAPLILVTYIGAWVFLIFPIWAIGIYIFAERSARKREHMPMLEHTEAIGIMMFVFFPTLLSFIGTLIFYLLVVNEHTSKVLY
jgi:hypothetical protein|tara:strand:- start:57 stop:596 length:540 start_codon:yes stop_codon:yes gene_type:complete